MSRTGDPGDLRRQLADACRILAHEGQEHFFLGHASVRGPEPGTCWVKPSGLGLGEVHPGDLVLVDLAGRRLVGDLPLHGELPIHLTTYRRRPDIGAIVHTHPPHVAAFSATDAEFQFVSQDSLVAADGIARYDDPGLIDSPEAGERLLDTLGSLSAAILRNHGLVAVGRSIADAVVLAVSVERSLATQLEASRFGRIHPIAAADVARIAASFGPGRTAAIYAWLARQAGIAVAE